MTTAKSIALAAALMLAAIPAMAQQTLTVTIAGGGILNNTGPCTLDASGTTFTQAGQIDEWPGDNAHWARCQRNESFEALLVEADPPLPGDGELCWELRGDANFGSYTISILEGATTRATFTAAYPPTPAAGNAWGDECVTVASAALQAVTEWSDVRVKFLATCTSSCSTGMDIDAFYLEIPDGAVCGDGATEGAEECDDGGANVTPGTCPAGGTCCTTGCVVEIGPPTNGGCWSRMFGGAPSSPSMHNPEMFP